MTTHLLVVLLDGASRADLEAAVAASVDDDGEPVVHIVAPTRVGALDWLATDESRAHGEAAARVLEAEWLLAETVEAQGEPGAGDPVLAVADALRGFSADAIVVVGSGAIDAPLLASLRSFGLPVTLSGLAVAPPSAASSGRALARGLISGRNASTPFVAFVLANVGFLLAAVLGSLIVAALVWLISSR